MRDKGVSRNNEEISASVDESLCLEVVGTKMIVERGAVQKVAGLSYH